MEQRVAELVDRAGLAEHPQAVGVIEEAQQPPRQVAAQGKPASYQGEPTPCAEDEPDREPAREPNRGPAGESVGQPEREPQREPPDEPAHG